LTRPADRCDDPRDTDGGDDPPTCLMRSPGAGASQWRDRAVAEQAVPSRMPTRRSRFAALAFALVIAATGSVLPSPPPARAALQVAGFQDTVVIDGLTNPMWVEFAADGRVFVAEKSGLIKVFPGLGEPGTVFADLRTEAQNFWDRGLMSIALHPDFPNTPWLYALYTRDALPGGSAPQWGDTCPSPPGATTDGCVVTGRLVRFTANGNVAGGAPTTLVTDWCQQFPSHSLGALVFGPDGMLYASGGEGANFAGIDYGQRGGSAGSPTLANPCGDPPNPAGTANTPPSGEGGALRSQDYRTAGDPYGLNGSIIRIDPVTGAAAAGNPTHTDANARRIVGYGLRNPYRFTFRPGSNEVWIADVGWTVREEIDRITNVAAPVENFGWPCYEGTARQGTYDNANLTLCENLYAQAGAVTDPWFSYPHSGPLFGADTCVAGSGASISGIGFYDGGSYPAAYDGALFFSDYSRKCIWAALPPSAGALPSTANLQTFMTEASNPVGLRTGPGGDLYYVDFGDPAGTIANGAIHRIHYVPGNQPPVASFTATPPYGPVPLSVTFDASATADPDAGDILSYAWDLDNDGSFDDGTDVTAQRTFTQAADAIVRLRVTDSSAATDVESVTVHAGNSPPIPVIGSPNSSRTWHVGEVVQFSGSANDGEGGSVAASGLDWSLVMHHCPGGDCHEHMVQTFPDRTSGFFTAPDHEYPSFLELVLTATDPQGLQASTSVELQPETVDLGFATSPTGAELSVGADTDQAPFTVTAIVGGTVSVSAPDQALGGNQLTFDHWSDGGGQTHDLVAPATPTTYTATFDVGAANRPPAWSPALTDAEAYEGITMKTTVHATDPDGDPVTYAATGLPPGFTIDAATGVIRGIAGYSGSGAFGVHVTASDGRGGTRSGVFTLTVHDALFPARRATFSPGTYTGYGFSATGVVTSTKAGTLSATSGASVDRRRLWNGRPYLHVVNGMWAGLWVPESGAIRLPGIVARVDFTAPRRATFLPGTYSGYLLSSTGNPVLPKTATLTKTSGASANARAVINGLPYLRFADGIWAGRWVPEHYLAIAAGTHTAYDIEGGVTSTAFTYRLGGASGASAVARVAGPGGWYLAVANGVFRDHWLKESSVVQRRVALSD
jgi:glucose/arabinose dehydrogenase